MNMCRYIPTKTEKNHFIPIALLVLILYFDNHANLTWLCSVVVACLYIAWISKSKEIPFRNEDSSRIFLWQKKLNSEKYDCSSCNKAQKMHINA